jgi:hypothetical protein
MVEQSVGEASEHISIEEAVSKFVLVNELMSGTNKHV